MLKIFMKYLFLFVFFILKVQSQDIEFHVTYYQSKGTSLWKKNSNSDIFTLDNGWVFVDHDIKKKIHIESLCFCKNPLCLFENCNFKLFSNKISCNNLDNFTLTLNEDGLAPSNIEVVRSQGLKSQDFSGYVSNVKKDGQVLKRDVISERCNNETCEIGECVNIFPNETICLCDKVVGNGKKCDKTFNTEKNDITCKTVKLGAAKFSSMGDWKKMSLEYEEDPNKKIDIYVEKNILFIETPLLGDTFKQPITTKFNNSGSHVVILLHDVRFKELRIYYYHNGGLDNKSVIDVELPKTFKLIPQIGKSIGIAAKISASQSFFDKICEENKNVTTPPRKSITEVNSVPKSNIQGNFSIYKILFAISFILNVCQCLWTFRNEIRNFVQSLRSLDSLLLESESRTRSSFIAGVSPEQDAIGDHAQVTSEILDCPERN